jgi:hypothetical protein
VPQVVPAQVAGARCTERSLDRIRKGSRLEWRAFQRREDQPLRTVGLAISPLLARCKLFRPLVSLPLAQQRGQPLR